MTTVKKRIEKLETQMAPPGKILSVIKFENETEEQAMARKGLTPKDWEEASHVTWLNIIPVPGRNRK